MAVEAHPIRRALRRVLSERRAVAAVEMAIAGPVFLLGLLGLFEFGYLFVAQLLVDAAAQNVARQIQTGQAASSTSWSSFSTNVVCPTMLILPCSSTNPMINFQALASPVTSSGYGPSSQFAVPVTNNQLNTAGFNYCNPTPGQLIQVNVVYMTPVFFGYFLPQTIGGQFPVTASAAFGDEAWPQTGSVAGGC